MDWLGSSWWEERVWVPAGVAGCLSLPGFCRLSILLFRPLDTEKSSDQTFTQVRSLLLVLYST